MNIFENIFNRKPVYTKEGTNDPTQGLAYKGLNLVGEGLSAVGTGYKSFVGSQQAELQAREAERKRKDDETTKLVIKDMLAQGIDEQTIFSTLDRLKAQGKLTTQPGMLESASQRFYGSLESGANRATQANTSQYSGLETGLAGGGNVLATGVGAPFNALFGGVIEAGMNKLPEGAKQTISDVGQAYGEFAQANPRTAFNLRTAGDIASVAPVPFVKPAGEAIATGVKTGVQKGVQVVKPIVQKTGELVSKVTPKVNLPKAEELLATQLEKTNRMNPTKYAEFEQLAGERAGKFLADRKITGDSESNVAKLYENFTKSKIEADKGLDAIQKTYKSSELPPEMVDMMGELNKRFAYTKDTQNLAKVKEMMSRAEAGSLSHTDINALKRLYEQKVKVNYIKDQNSLEVERATNIDNAVRSWQFDEAGKLGFDNLKLINKETQLNRFLADNIGDKIARQAGLNNISLTDWIIAGQVPATPQALALLAGKKLAQNVVPKLYQKGLEKLAGIKGKQTPVANIENIGKMEAIRKSITPNDTTRLLVPPRNSSRSPATVTTDVTLPKGEKGKATIKSPAIKSDITSKSKVVRPSSKPLSNESKVSKPTSSTNSTSTNTETVKKPLKKGVKPISSDSTRKVILEKLGIKSENKIQQTRELEQYYRYIQDKPVEAYKAIFGRSPSETGNANFAKGILNDRDRINLGYIQDDIGKAINDIPDGYFKNPFGEILKNPKQGNKGTIKIPSFGKDKALVEEARKYKSAEEFVNKGFIYKPPKKVYRGIASEEELSKRMGGTAFASLGKGLYTTTDKSFAKKFGKVQELDSIIAFPRNPLVIKRPFGPAVDALKNWMLSKTGLRNISDFHNKYGEDYSIYLQSLGYDGAVIGDEIVKYGGKKTDLQIKDELINIWKNSRNM